MIKADVNRVEQPFFSVVIATYNRAHLLNRALNSLLIQTMEDWEAIVVDDGSEDNTSQLIESYVKADKRIHYFKKEHSGVALTKNKGIELAKGQFVTFLDSDDAYKANHLMLRYKYLLNNSSIDFLHGGAKVIGNQFVPNRFDTTKKIHLSNCKIGGTFFVRKSCLIALSGFKNIPLAEDADLLERAKVFNCTLMKIKDPTYIYHRDHQESLTKNLFKQQNKLKNTVN